MLVWFKLKIVDQAQIKIVCKFVWYKKASDISHMKTTNNTNTSNQVAAVQKIFWLIFLPLMFWGLVFGIPYLFFNL